MDAKIDRNAAIDGFSEYVLRDSVTIVVKVSYWSLIGFKLCGGAILIRKIIAFSLNFLIVTSLLYFICIYTLVI